MNYSFWGRILPGLAADRFGRFNTMIVLAFLSTALIFGLWIPGNSLRPTIAFSAVFGFTSGCTVSLGPSMMFQISDMRTVTWKIALLYGLQSIAALFTSPIGGTLYVADHGPLYLQLFCGSICALATVFFVLARLQQTGLHLLKKC
jgi:predicted MFS family arabinose efflux permease